jgi:hypothetical protein
MACRKFVTQDKPFPSNALTPPGSPRLRCAKLSMARAETGPTRRSIPSEITSQNKKNPHRRGHELGSAGFQPAVFRILRNTRSLLHKLPGERRQDAG